MRETMYFFGILFKMNLNYVKERIDCLKKFFSIPSADRQCSQMRYGYKGVQECGIFD